MTTAGNNTSHNLLNVHAVLAVSYANGPGPRAAVWTQGCNLCCPGCCNPLTHSHSPNMLLDPQWLAGAILAVPGIEGVTISGGEPFEQAAAVGRLCRAVRRGGLSVMLFSGWTYEHINRCGNQTVRNLLDQIDILVAGPFIQHLADSHLLWRGSRNQQIRFLTGRYRPDVLQDAGPPQVEGRLSPGAPLQITGFPEQTDLAVLSQRLATEAGILLEPAETVETRQESQTHEDD